MILPVTVIVRTLNEEENIEECIKYCKANNPLEIIIVDGGSTDRTMEILSKIEDIKVIKSEKGLAKQRDIGILNSNPESKYIAIVDADDRLDENCIACLYNDLESTNAAAAQAIHKSLSIVTGKNMNYWEKAMLVNMNIIRDIDVANGDIHMIGRPALYNKDALLDVIKDSTYSYTTAAEDADLAYRLKKNGAVFSIGTGITYRKHLDSFDKLYKRWMSYGSGDAKFIKTHPERVFKVIKHLLYVYPIKRSLYCAFKYSPLYSPFFVLQGWVRFLGMIKYFIIGIGKSDNYKSI